MNNCLEAIEMPENSETHNRELDAINAVVLLGTDIIDIDQSLHKYDEIETFVAEDADELLQIQVSLTSRYQLLVDLTQTFLEILEQPVVFEEPEEADEDVVLLTTDKTPEINIYGFAEEIAVELQKKEEIYKANGIDEEQKKVLDDEYRNTKEKYHSMLKELKMAKKEFLIAKKQKELLYEKACRVNNAPIYECTVAVSIAVDKVSNDKKW